MRVVHEDDRCYRMSDGTVIAKAGLSDGTHARIRGYARGGQVLESLSAEDQALADQAAAEALAAQDVSEQPAPVPFTPGPIASAPEVPYTPGPIESVPAAPVITSPTAFPPAMAVAAKAFETAQGITPGDVALAAGSALPVVGPLVAGAGAVDRSGVLDAPREALLGFTNPQPVASLPGALPPGRQQGSEPAPMPGGVARAPGSMEPRAEPYREDPAIAKGLRAQQVSAEGAAAIEKARLADAAQKELDNAAAMEARRAEYERQRAEIQGRAEKMANEVASGRLDPNRLWGKIDTGQRLGNAISMILGGIGSALAGGPNQALRVIEGAIDRDIESQKDERTRKEGLLQFHIAQGRDLTQAYELAKADMLSIAAGKMRGAANRYGSMATAATALDAAGKLEMMGAELRAKGLKADLDARVQRAQIGAMRANAAESLAKIGAMRGEQAGAANLNALTNALVNGANIDPRILEQLPEEKRKRVVQTKPGFYALAGSAEGAKAIETAQTMNRQMKPMIKEYEAIRARHPHGWITGVGDYEDKGRAQTLYSALTTKLKDVLNLGVMSDSDRELLQQQIPNLVDFSPTVKYDAQLAQLGTNIDRALSSVYDAHLLRKTPETIAFAKE